MRLSPENMDIANDLRSQIKAQTETVSDGEGVAMVLLWTFFADHAKAHDIDLCELARVQFESFMEFAEDGGLEMVQEH